MLLPETIPFRNSKPFQMAGQTERYGQNLHKTNFLPAFIPPFYTHIAARRNRALKNAAGRQRKKQAAIARFRAAGRNPVITLYSAEIMMSETEA